MRDRSRHHQEPMIDDGRRSGVSWLDAIVTTAALWSFTLLIYLPMIIARYDGLGLSSVLIDSSTIIVSILFAMLLFVLFRWTFRLDGKLRLVIMTMAVLLVAVAQSAFDILFIGLISHNFEARWIDMPQDLRRSYGAAFNYATVFAVNCALFQLSASRRRALRQERELSDFRAKAKQAEVDSLRLKLNPHFLFNTLNVISAMVVTRRNDEAEEGLERLSAFLRTSIDGDAMAVSALEDQLQLVDHYLQLEEMRFGSRLAIAIDCSGDVAGLAVPPLLIQPLVEAVIRDGVEPTSMPVQVRIAALRTEDALELSVSDDAPRATADGATAVAESIRSRLWALYGSASAVDVHTDEGGVTTRLRMPVASI